LRERIREGINSGGAEDSPRCLAGSLLRPARPPFFAMETPHDGPENFVGAVDDVQAPPAAKNAQHFRQILTSRATRAEPPALVRRRRRRRRRASTAPRATG